MDVIDPVILILIRFAAASFDVEAPLIAAVVEWESGFDPSALGDRDEEGVPHSFGLGQLHDQGAGYGYPPDLLLNPAFNVMVVAKYLRYLQATFPNNIKLAISAYNQGAGGAAKRGYGYNEKYVNGILLLREKWVKELKKG